MYSIAVTVCAYIKYVQTLTTILDSVGIPTISKITVRTDVVIPTALRLETPPKERKAGAMNMTAI